MKHVAYSSKECRLGGYKCQILLMILLVITVFALSTQRITAAEARQKFILPVRVHMVEFTTLKDFKNDLTDEEVIQLFAGANKIWAQADIEWKIESIIHKPAINQEKFIQTFKRYNSKLSRKKKLSMKQAHKISQKTCSREHWLKGGWNVCIIPYTHVGSGGVFFQFRRGTMVLLPARNKQGKLNPAIVAHELGHSLGLKHKSMKQNNLMTGSGNNMRYRSPKSKITITPDEISKARKQAEKGKPFHTKRKSPPNN